MKRAFLFGLVLLVPASVHAQTAQDVATFTPEEQAAVAAILARQTPPSAEKQNNIILPEETKQAAQAQLPEDPEEPTAPAGTCLTVAFIDIDEAFNAHPRTIAVKEQIHLKIAAKEQEVQSAKQLITILRAENKHLAAQLRALKPFYQRIVVEPHPLLPSLEEKADTLQFTNVLNRLTFAGADVLSASPLNTPAQLEDLQARIAANKKIIEERELFIDTYKYTTREEILKLERNEVNEILQDIYTEIKSFAKKRNIGAVVRKDELLYGQKPVNVTQDFINRLKKAKKYRKRGN